MIRKLVLLTVIAFTGLGGLQPDAMAQTSNLAGKIAFVRKGSIWTWQHGDAKRLFKDGAVSDPRWSPDGKQILFVRSGDSYSDLVLRVVETKEETPLTANQPTGEVGSPEYTAATSWVVDPSWANSGPIGFISDAASPDGTFNLWLIDSLESSPVIPPLPGDEAYIDSLSLSPDATVGAYLVREFVEDEQVVTVRLRDIATGETHPLIADSGVLDPAIAPDGRRVAVVVRDDSGSSDIWVVDDFSGKRTRVTTGLQTAAPCWNPDGSWLAFFVMVDYEFELWVVPFDGTKSGAPEKLYSADGNDPTSNCSWAKTGQQ